MDVSLLWRRIWASVLAVVVLVVVGLAIYFRIEQRRLAVEDQKLLAEIRELRPHPVPTAEMQMRGKPSTLFEVPVTERTALSFYWFGDMDSHFRDPINFYVVSDSDPSLHKMRFDLEGVRTSITAEEMKRIIEGLKALNLSWWDSRGREDFKDKLHRQGTDMLDITLVSADSTAKAHIRIARMCKSLDQLDPMMPTPRILWQFRTFRWDNGCEIPGYVNYQIPDE